MTTWVAREHHRFEAAGKPFVYLVPSAAIFALDGAADAVLRAVSAKPRTLADLVAEFGEGIEATLGELVRVRAVGDLTSPPAPASKVIPLAPLDLAERVPLAGVKQSGADFEYHRALVRLGREKNFVVWTGSDTRIPEAMALGVSGCVSGLANAVPELVVEVFKGMQDVLQLGRHVPADVVLAPAHVRALRRARAAQARLQEADPVVPAVNLNRYDEAVGLA